MNDLECLLNKKICLYGFGVYGIRTYFLLEKYGIIASCFADRDEKKWGYAIGGLNCISYHEVLDLDKEKYSIVVCNKNSDDIMAQFVEAGFLYVFCLKDIIDSLSNNKSDILMCADENEVQKLKYAIEQILIKKNDYLYKGFGDQLVADLRIIK